MHSLHGVVLVELVRWHRTFKLDISRSGYQYIKVVVASIGYHLLCIGGMQIECKLRYVCAWVLPLWTHIWYLEVKGIQSIMQYIPWRIQQSTLLLQGRAHIISLHSLAMKKSYCREMSSKTTTKLAEVLAIDLFYVEYMRLLQYPSYLHTYKLFFSPRTGFP